jgi:hypothetical protein
MAKAVTEQADQLAAPVPAEYQVAVLGEILANHVVTVPAKVVHMVVVVQVVRIVPEALQIVQRLQVEEVQFELFGEQAENFHQQMLLQQLMKR